MSDCCVAIDIITRYETEELSTKVIEKYFNKTFERIVIRKFSERVKCFPEMFPVHYIQNYSKILKCINESGSDFRQIIKSDLPKTCLICHKTLTSKLIYTDAHLYMHGSPSLSCRIPNIKCKNCNCKFYLSFYIKGCNSERIFYDGILNQKYICFSYETVFEILLLKSLTKDIIYKHCSFKNYCSSYNALFEHEKIKQNTSQKNNRRNNNIICQIILNRLVYFQFKNV